VETGIEDPLRIRMLIVCGLFLVVTIANLFLAVHVNSTQQARNELFTAQNVELESRVAETRSVLAEAAQLRQQTSDVLEQTAKLTSSPKRPTTDGGPSAAAK
jgi:hypothetical protein